MINKDTKIYGSFSTTPGNNGCDYFNNLFQSKNINAIYKSFYSNDIGKSIEAAITLNFLGFAVSMPFKTEVLKYTDTITPGVKIIGAANTIVNNNGTLTAYNTDWLGVYNFLSTFSGTLESHITILGNGGFSKAAQYACNKLNISTNIIERDKWDLVPQLKGIIFNCTPVEVYTKGILIDGRPSTPDGKKIASLQAEEQFKIYTNES